jgi:hypothetical protein
LRKNNKINRKSLLQEKKIGKKKRTGNNYDNQSKEKKKKNNYEYEFRRKLKRCSL